MKKENNWIGVVIKSGLFGILIFLSGFGVMSILWKFSTYSSGLRGFDYYLAAFWGDRICLPLLVGLAVMFILFQGRISKKQNMISYGIGFMSALLAIAVQGSWLISDTTVLNWTIPSQHHFNFAGWYHAVFFVIMFFIVGYIFSRIWFIRRLTNQQEIYIREDVLFAGIIAAGSGFIFLLSVDDLTSNLNTIVVLLIIFFGLLVCMLLFCVTSRRKTILRDLLSIISGEGFSLGLVISLLNKTINLTYFLLAITAAIFTVVFCVPDCRNPINSKIRFILIAAPTGVMNYALFTTSNTDLLQLVIMSILIIAIPSAMGGCLREYGKVDLRTVSFMLLAPAYVFMPLFIKYIFKNDLEGLESIINAILTFAVYFLSKFYISDKLFGLVIKNEQDNNSSSEQDSKIKDAVYFNIVMTVIGNFLYFAMFIFLSPNNFEKSINAKIPTWSRLDILLLVIFIILVLVLLIIKKKNSILTFKIISIIIAILGYGIMAILIYSLRKPLYVDWRLLIIIFPVIGSALMLSRGYYANILGLHGLKVNRFDIVTRCFIFVGAVVNAMVSILPSKSIDNSPESPVLYFVISLCGIFSTYVLLPYLLSCINYHITKETRLIRSKATASIAQDGFTAALIILMAGLIPVYYSSVSNKGIILLIMGVGLILVMIYWPFDFCLKNNQDHYKRKLEEYSLLLNESDQDKDILEIQIKALHKHLSFQNMCTYFSAFPFLVPYDLVKIIKNYFTSEPIFNDTSITYAFLQPEKFFKQYLKKK